MRILLTGGAGFIGSHVYDRLAELNYDITVLDDLSTGDRKNLPPHVNLCIGDIAQASDVAGVFARGPFDIICHHAAQISVSRSVRNPIRDAEINCIGLLNILEQANRVGCRRFVFAASGGTLYGEVTKPASELDSARPKSPYGVSKWVGERYLQIYAEQCGLEVVILRYGNVYGPRQNPHGEAGVVSIFCRNLLRGAPITIFGDGGCVRDYVYVKDVADANVRAIQNTDIAPGQVIVANIGTGTGLCVSSIAHAIKIEIQAQLPDITLPETKFGAPRPGDLRNSVLNPARAQEKLNWRATTNLAQGLRETVAWFRSADI